MREFCTYSVTSNLQQLKAYFAECNQSLVGDLNAALSEFPLEHKTEET